MSHVNKHESSAMKKSRHARDAQNDIGNATIKFPCPGPSVPMQDRLPLERRIMGFSYANQPMISSKHNSLKQPPGLATYHSHLNLAVYAHLHLPMSPRHEKISQHIQSTLLSRRPLLWPMLYPSMLIPDMQQLFNTFLKFPHPELHTTKSQTFSLSPFLTPCGCTQPSWSR